MKNFTETTKERVKDYLTHNPELRNNDSKLIAYIWRDDFLSKYSTQGLFERKASDVFFWLEQGYNTNPESIRRFRQKLQQEHPELRGENYRGRQENQTEVKQILGYPV